MPLRCPGYLAGVSAVVKLVSLTLEQVMDTAAIETHRSSLTCLPKYGFSTIQHWKEYGHACH